MLCGLKPERERERESERERAGSKMNKDKKILSKVPSKKKNGKVSMSTLK